MSTRREKASRWIARAVGADKELVRIDDDPRRCCRNDPQMINYLLRKAVELRKMPQRLQKRKRLAKVRGFEVKLTGVGPVLEERDTKHG